jgi:hypothetical protein
VSTLTTLEVDGATVASMGLPEKERFEATGGGTLGTRGVHIWRSDDGTCVTGVWECDAGRFHAEGSSSGPGRHARGRCSLMLTFVYGVGVAPVVPSLGPISTT